MLLDELCIGNLLRTSLLFLPLSLPIASTVHSPAWTSCVISMGPGTHPFGIPSNLFDSSSSTGSWPNSHWSFPPYATGKSSSLINVLSILAESVADKTCILDVVIGSNHFLIHPHTVGKYDGAPTILEKLQSLAFHPNLPMVQIVLTYIRSSVSG